MFLNNFVNFFENKSKIYFFINIVDVLNVIILIDNFEVVFGFEIKVEFLVEFCFKFDGVEW